MDVEVLGPGNAIDRYCPGGNQGLNALTSVGFPANDDPLRNRPPSSTKGKGLIDSGSTAGVSMNGFCVKDDIFKLNQIQNKPDLLKTSKETICQKAIKSETYRNDLFSNSFIDGLVEKDVLVDEVKGIRDKVKGIRDKVDQHFSIELLKKDYKCLTRKVDIKVGVDRIIADQKEVLKYWNNLPSQKGSSSTVVRPSLGARNRTSLVPNMQGVHGKVCNAGNTCYISSFLQFVGGSDYHYDKIEQIINENSEHCRHWDHAPLFQFLNYTKELVDCLRNGDNVSAQQIRIFIDFFNRTLSPGSSFQLVLNRQDSTEYLLNKLIEAESKFSPLEVICCNEIHDSSIEIPYGFKREQIDGLIQAGSLADIYDFYLNYCNSDTGQYHNLYSYMMHEALMKEDEIGVPLYKTLGYSYYEDKTVNGLKQFRYQKVLQHNIMLSPSISLEEGKIDLEGILLPYFDALNLNDQVQLNLIRYGVGSDPRFVQIQGKNNDQIVNCDGLVTIADEDFRIVTASVHSPDSDRDGGHWTTVKWNEVQGCYYYYSDFSDPIRLDSDQFNEVSGGFTALVLERVQ